jgi:hypothetical protein
MLPGVRLASVTGTFSTAPQPGEKIARWSGKRCRSELQSAAIVAWDNLRCG